MPQEPTPPFLAPTDRFIEILVGLIALTVSGFLAYYGVLGLWMYLLGSRAAPASPVGWVFGLGAGAFGGYAGVRMLFGIGRDKVLVPNTLLYIGGTFAIIGGVVAPFVDLPRGVMVGATLAAAGAGAFTLARRRRPSP